MPNATSYASGEVGPDSSEKVVCFQVGLESVVGETGVTYISIRLNNGYSLVIITRWGPKTSYTWSYDKWSCGALITTMK